MKKILSEKGSIAETDAGRVVHTIQVNSMVEFKKLEQLFHDVKQYWLEKSESVRKVKDVIAGNIKQIIKYFEAEDLNKDGELFIHGFIAALRREEFRQLSKEDLEESFHLISQRNGMLLYQQWLLEWNKDWRQYFSHIVQSTEKT